MYKKIIVIFLAILIGGVLAFLTVYRLNDEKYLDNYVTINVLQTGVYTNYENALAQKNTLDNAIIVTDGEYYRVIVGASTTESGLTKIAKLLTEQNIIYYKREITVLESEKERLNQYNLLLEEASNDETVLLVNQKILESMEVS